MATLSKEQIEAKMQQLKTLSEKMTSIHKELEEAGALPLDDDDLDQVAGGLHSYSKPTPKPTIVL